MNKRLLALATLAAIVASSVWAQTPPPGGYPFEGGFPTPAASQQARDDADFERAVIAYRFWYPTVSMEGVFDGPRSIGVEDNKAIVIVKATPDLTVFTANSDTPYASGVIDVSNGPMVVEVPPGPFVGLVDDHNQGWVLDIGLPGPDAGRGGKHLVLPPGYSGEIPKGYFAGRSPTLKNYVAIRSLPLDGNMDKALNALRGIRIYPLSTAAQPQLVRIEAPDAATDATLLRWEDNIGFWQQLHAIVDAEPVKDEFRPMLGLLAELGIEKGKPFLPDERMTAILERAARTGRDQMLVAAFDSRRPDRVHWPDRRWEWVSLVADNPDFETPAGMDLDARDRWFAQAIVASPAMFRRTPGAGSLYWLADRDDRGRWLDGGKTYRLVVPQPVPAKLFWSVTVYDAQTRSEIKTDQDKAALRSLFELKGAPKDAPLTLTFGPKAPEGQEDRWIKTIPGRGWFAYFRIYGPETAAFDKSWKPGDFEETR